MTKKQIKQKCDLLGISKSSTHGPTSKKIKIHWNAHIIQDEQYYQGYDLDHQYIIIVPESNRDLVDWNVVDMELKKPYKVTHSKSFYIAFTIDSRPIGTEYEVYINRETRMIFFLEVDAS